MKISNFRDYEEGNDGYKFATVDVTTKRFLFAARVRAERIYIDKHGVTWRSLTTGEYMPSACGDLENAFLARKNLNTITSKAA